MMGVRLIIGLSPVASASNGNVPAKSKLRCAQAWREEEAELILGNEARRNRERRCGSVGSSLPTPRFALRRLETGIPFAAHSASTPHAGDDSEEARVDRCIARWPSAGELQGVVSGRALSLLAGNELATMEYASGWVVGLGEYGLRASTASESPSIPTSSYELVLDFQLRALRCLLMRTRRVVACAGIVPMEAAGVCAAGDAMGRCFSFFILPMNEGRLRTWGDAGSRRVSSVYASLLTVVRCGWSGGSTSPPRLALEVGAGPTPRARPSRRTVLELGRKETSLSGEGSFKEKTVYEVSWNLGSDAEVLVRLEEDGEGRDWDDGVWVGMGVRECMRASTVDKALWPFSFSLTRIQARRPLTHPLNPATTLRSDGHSSQVASLLAPALRIESPTLEAAAVDKVAADSENKYIITVRFHGIAVMATLAPCVGDSSIPSDWDVLIEDGVSSGEEGRPFVMSLYLLWVMDSGKSGRGREEKRSGIEGGVCVSGVVLALGRARAEYGVGIRGGIEIRLGDTVWLAGIDAPGSPLVPPRCPKSLWISIFDRCDAC
ncbi:hypothetical protein R3P38DRAFT_3368408 [Favolaschia claudopus]|uniref:Uncharacterized protein n=1 Tax=Favolaschia claudopus TaxID=2862362 RepID=A0AAW0A5Q3_9AGAR